MHKKLISIYLCIFIGRKSVPKLFYKLYQHLRDEDDESDEDENGINNGYTKWSKKLQQMDGITAEHAKVIEESDIIMTFLNNIGKTKSAPINHSADSISQYFVKIFMIRK